MIAIYVAVACCLFGGHFFFRRQVMHMLYMCSACLCMCSVCTCSVCMCSMCMCMCMCMSAYTRIRTCACARTHMLRPLLRPSGRRSQCFSGGGILLTYLLTYLLTHLLRRSQCFSGGGISPARS